MSHFKGKSAKIILGEASESSDSDGDDSSSIGSGSYDNDDGGDGGEATNQPQRQQFSISDRTQSTSSTSSSAAIVDSINKNKSTSSTTNIITPTIKHHQNDDDVGGGGESSNFAEVSHRPLPVQTNRSNTPARINNEQQGEMVPSSSQRNNKLDGNAQWPTNPLDARQSHHHHQSKSLLHDLLRETNARLHSSIGSTLSSPYAAHSQTIGAMARQLITNHKQLTQWGAELTRTCTTDWPALNRSFQTLNLDWHPLEQVTGCNAMLVDKSMAIVENRHMSMIE